MYSYLYTLFTWIHRTYLAWLRVFETSISIWVQCYLKKKISPPPIFSQDGTISSKAPHDLPMLLALGENRYLLLVHSAQASSFSAWFPGSHENKTNCRTWLEQGSLFLALSPDSGQIALDFMAKFMSVSMLLVSPSHTVNDTHSLSKYRNLKLPILC